MAGRSSGLAAWTWFHKEPLAIANAKFPSNHLYRPESRCRISLIEDKSNKSIFTFVGNKELSAPLRRRLQLECTRLTETTVNNEAEAVEPL